MKHVSKTVESALTAYKDNLASFLLSGLMIFVALFVTLFLSVFVLFGNDTINTLVYLSENPTDTQFFIDSVTPFSVSIASIIALLGFGVTYALMGGIVEISQLALRKKKFYTTDVMFRVAKKKGTTLVFARVLSLAFFLVAALGAYLLSGLVGSVFPATLSETISSSIMSLTLIIVSTFFLTLDQAVVLDNKRAWASLTSAYEFAKRNFLRLFILVVLFTVISGVVSYIPFGFFLRMMVVLPLSILAYTHFYIRNRKR